MVWSEIVFPALLALAKPMVPLRDRAPAAAFVPDGGTYFLLDLRAVVAERGGTIWPLVEDLLADGVSVSPGEQFGSAFASHARICYSAVPLDRLVVGIDRLHARFRRA